MIEVKLPSGAVLKVQVAPFAEAKALYQAVLEEVKSIQFGGGTDMASLFKDLACIGFSSKKIEKCLEDCMKRCLYNDMKIDKDTFEPVERRDDYFVVCMAIAKENIHPFAKSLYAEYKAFLATTGQVQS